MTQIIMTSNQVSYDAERALLSCTRYDDDECYKTFAFAIEQEITADHFENEACRNYWNALVLAEKEGELGMLGAFGRLPSFQNDNPWFIDEVLECHEIPRSHRGEKAVKELIRFKQFRDLEAIGHNLELRVKDADVMDNPVDLASAVEKEVQELIQPKSNTLTDAREGTSSAISEIRKSLVDGPARIEPHLPWLKTGLRGGFKDGHTIVIAARPSVGKTTLAVNFVYHAALQGKKILFFSLEMKAEALWEKFGLIRSGNDEGLDYRTANQAKNKSNAKDLIQMIEECQDLPIFIDDDGASSIGQIRATSRIMHRKHSLDCIVIDYLGLVRPEDSKISREQQIADISRRCKALAKELDRPVIVVAQLNRDSSKGNREPQLHDLRDSGQIEQDCDVALLLHRNLMGDKEDVKVIVAKQRSGGTGHSRERIKFKPNSQRFIEVRNNSLNSGQSEMTTNTPYEPEPRI